jgi:uncharacterized protein (TIGR03083 family)
VAPTENIAPRLLLTERDLLLPILRGRTEADFDAETALPGWRVRDVLAHCSAALGMAVSGRFHAFTPEDNQRDVDARREWPVAKLLDELADGYTGAAAAIAAAGGRMDRLALGEWVHGGDVRDAWGLSEAYASGGVEDALILIADFSQRPESTVPPTDVAFIDGGRIRLGRGEPVVELETDTATFVRMIAGRGPDPARIRPPGASIDQYVQFH